MAWERRVAEVEVDAAGQHRVKTGVEEYSMLKTTQSGFEGFIRDQNTLLPDTRERILATTVQATWSYSRDPPCFNAAYSAAKAALTDTFFGPPQGGVYSPSVQRTLFLMGEEVLSRVPEADSVHLKLPNLHFIPVNLPGIGLKVCCCCPAPTLSLPSHSPLTAFSILPVPHPLHASPALISCEDDVYLPTSEPHGSIEPCVSRKTAALTARL
ncbi:unnamed protein product [Closterium sp. NIES-64]|nr:unnamed protein product [Closterium sp. NIES-64]